MEAAEEMKLLGNALDGLDRLFDSESGVIDISALTFATAQALKNTCHFKILFETSRSLETVVRSGASKEEARDEALKVTDSLRHYLADIDLD